MSNNSLKDRITFNETSTCPYFEDGRMSVIEYFIPMVKDTKNFHKFLSQGFRRIGRVFYKNICDGCLDCMPLRLSPNTFILSRSHKRTLKSNEDIRVEVPGHSHITADKIHLYNKYVNTKHPDIKPEEPVDSVNTLMNIHYGYTRTIEIDYYLDNELVGVGIVDESENSLSSNYFYYDTDYLDRRLGVFSILQEISLAKSLGKKYYYLGFYIEENPKMSYKKYFRPNQVLKQGGWVSFLKE
jgi:arginine-tRNA-protein transferase